MSIVSPNSLNPKSLIILAIFGYFIALKPCYAWDGYDYENDAQIEINSGNLVREGEIIKFYDWKEEEVHTAEVKSVQASFAGTRVEVYDLNSKKIRTFDMGQD